MKNRSSSYVAPEWLFRLLSVSLLLASSLSMAYGQTRVYENRQFHFAITAPASWKVQETNQAGTFTVKFVGEDGFLTVAVKEAQKFHKTTIGLIKEYDLNEKQLADLNHTLYSQVPGVVNPTITITMLANERALASKYVYELRTLNLVGYMAVFKLETIRMDKFYKVEIATPVSRTTVDAEKKFSRTFELLKDNLKTFTFLPS